MINLRKLTAIDIAFLGYKFVLTEYVIGVFFSAALGLFVLFRSQSFWQAVSVTACALGMLCKESMVVAPVVILFYDRV